MAGKVLRVVGWGVGAVVALVTAVLLALVVFVDPNDFKDDITQAVQEATGRELSLQGDIELSVFPWLGLNLGAAQLSNAAGFDGATFARVESVDIKLKLMPLLQQRIEMKTLNLHGLQLNLVRAADGRSNWDDLLVSSGQTADTAAAEAPPTESAEPASPARATTPAVVLAIGGVNIVDAQIHWDDQQVGQRIAVEQLSLRTGSIVLGQPIEIHLNTQLSLSEPAVKTPVELSALLTMDPQAKHYRLDDLVLSVSLRSEQLPVSPLDIRLSAEVDADLAQQRVTISALQVQSLGLSAKAALTLEQLLSTPQVNGQLSLANFSPRELATLLGVALPSSADPKVLNKASVSMDFTASPSAVSMKNMVLVADVSQLTGSLNVQDFAKPVLQFDLNLDAIDVDRYLPPAPAENAVTEKQSADKGSIGNEPEDAQLPLALIRGLNINGDLRVAKFKLAGARVNDVQLTVNARDGQIRLHPVKTQLYSGQFDGDIRLDVRKAGYQGAPKLMVNGALKTVNVGPLLKDVLGEDKVSGVASAQVKLTAKGMGVETIKKTLNGAANFSFEDGAVKGVNLGQMIREAYAKLKKKPKPPKQTNTTDFADMTGSVNIKNGLVSNDDLDMKSPCLRISGKGTVDLVQEKIRYRINAAIVETDQGQAGKELAELKSLNIPIKVRGTFAKPKFSLDLGPVLKAKTQQELQRQKAKLKEEAKQKLKEEKARAKKRLKEKLKKKLKSLF